MQTHMNRQNTSYARRKALSLEVNADILVAFLMSMLRGIKKFRAQKIPASFIDPKNHFCQNFRPQKITRTSPSLTYVSGAPGPVFV